MSVLTWLFGLGALGIALPLIFHLIRRTPKGQQEFSSLMFLRPSPPTLTRRSRLENLLLLFLRAAAIALLAFAFMRPFWRTVDTELLSQVSNRRVAILVDTSASMKRGNLKEKTIEAVADVLAKLETKDDVSLITFDRNATVQIPFDDGLIATDESRSTEITVSQTEKRSAIMARLKELEPTWYVSDLGNAMAVVADRMDVWRDSNRENLTGPQPKLQLVVVSDFDGGSKTDALQSFQWPQDIFVQFKPIAVESNSNATVQLLHPVEDEPNQQRIRVRNALDSKVDQFEVTWEGRADDTPPLTFYVPAGNSRVLKLDRDDSLGSSRFTVSGDSDDFDNQFFVVPVVQETIDVVYIGEDDPNDAGQQRFYLDRSLVESSARKFDIRSWGEGETLVRGDGIAPTLVVVGGKCSAETVSQLKAYLSRGGNVLVTATDKETAQSAAQWMDIEWQAQDDLQTGPGKNGKRNYSILAEIDFRHPFFAPFANPKFNDFTRVRFWQNQEIQLTESSSMGVLARLDNDQPLIIEQTFEPELPGGKKGRSILLTSGWHPEQSQLALSSKFLPMINNLIELSLGRPEVHQSLRVGESIELPPAMGQRRKIIMPDQSEIKIDSQLETWEDTNIPGIYQLVVDEDSETNTDTNSQNISSQSGLWQFAVNVDRSESDGSVLETEELELFGVKVGQQTAATEEITRLRLLRDRELEGSQKIWKWLILAAIFFVISETWLAGRTETEAAQAVTGEPA